VPLEDAKSLIPPAFNVEITEVSAGVAELGNFTDFSVWPSQKLGTGYPCDAYNEGRSTGAFCVYVPRFFLFAPGDIHPKGCKKAAACQNSVLTTYLHNSQC